MINIDFENGKRVHVTGHGNMAPKGKDIVCSAVTILCYTLDESLKDMGIDVKSTFKSGDSEIVCDDERALGAYRFTLCGFKLLAQSFPENVKLNLIG